MQGTCSQLAPDNPADDYMYGGATPSFHPSSITLYIPSSYEYYRAGTDGPIVSVLNIARFALPFAQLLARTAASARRHAALHCHSRGASGKRRASFEFDSACTSAGGEKSISEYMAPERARRALDQVAHVLDWR